MKRRFLIISLNFLGDILMTMPLAYNLRKRYPNADIAVCIGGKGKAVISLLDGVDLWIVRGEKDTFFNMRKVYKEAKAFSPDTVFLIRDSKYTHKMAKISGAKNIYSLSVPKISSFELTTVKMSSDKLHITDKVKLLAEQVGVKEFEYKVDFKDIRCKNEFFNYIVFLPGTTRNAKMWNAERWQKLAEKISKTDKKIILLGSKADSYYSGKIKGENVIDLIGKTSLQELFCLLKSASLLVTVDNGGMHLADFLDVPIIALFGSTDFRVVGPKSKKAVVLESPFECKYCGKNVCKNDRFCMDFIDEDDVFAQVKRILNR